MKPREPPKKTGGDEKHIKAQIAFAGKRGRSAKKNGRRKMLKGGVLRKSFPDSQIRPRSGEKAHLS